MTAITSVIFDLDGVIVFTDEYHFLAWKVIADRLGIPFDNEVNNLLRGVSRMESLDIILRHGGVVLTDAEKYALAEEKNNYYRDYLETMTPAGCSDEVRETLDTLRGMGLKLAIGSSSKNAKTILGKIGLGDYFDAVSDGTNITRTKPDPEVFLCAAQFLGVPPESCIVVEDAVAGIEAGHRAGMRTIAIGSVFSVGKDTAFSDRKDTAGGCPPATWTIDRFSEITGIVRQ